MTLPLGKRDATRKPLSGAAMRARAPTSWGVPPHTHWGDVRLRRATSGRSPTCRAPLRGRHHLYDSVMDLRVLLGVELPIVQAPMAGAQGSAMAAAVSNAGGLGSLPAALLSPDGLRAELEALRRLTTRPFNVNFFC